jgi:hypothetical protein
LPNRPQCAIRLVRAHQLCVLPKRLIQLKIASVRYGDTAPIVSSTRSS